MRIRLTTTADIAVLAGLFLPAPARADCQPVGTIEEALQTAQVAFVGTVLVARPGEAGATFRVEEKGSERSAKRWRSSAFWGAH